MGAGRRGCHAAGAPQMTSCSTAALALLSSVTAQHAVCAPRLLHALPPHPPQGQNPSSQTLPFSPMTSSFVQRDCSTPFHYTPYEGKYPEVPSTPDGLHMHKVRVGQGKHHVPACACFSCGWAALYMSAGLVVLACCGNQQAAPTNRPCQAPQHACG